MEFTMQEKLEFVAMKIDAARQHIVDNMQDERPGMEVNAATEEAAIDWATNEMHKWQAVYQTLEKADGPFHGIEYCLSQFIVYKVNHFGVEEEDPWYPTLDDFLEGQLISD